MSKVSACLALALALAWALGTGTVANAATVSGVVTGERPFKAAKVRAMNLDKQVLYMAYTSKGAYRLVGLMAGKYEVSVLKDGLQTDARVVAIKSNDEMRLDFRLRGGGPTEFLKAQSHIQAPWQTQTREYRLYDQLYPAGPDRDLMERSCRSCHDNPAYMSGHPRTPQEWQETVSSHLGSTTRKVSDIDGNEVSVPGRISSDTLSAADAGRIASYLAANFPAGPPLGVRFELDEMPLDESILGKAMYVEYYVPVYPQGEGEHTYRRAQDPQLDQHGNVWFTDNGVPSRVGVLNPRTAEFKDYPLASAHAYPHGLAVDRLGDIWWSERDVPYIGRLNPASGKITNYPSDPESLIKAKRYSHTPIVDSKQNVWFSNIMTNSIGKWDRKEGRVSETFRFATPNGRAYGMAIDRDDTLWVAETEGCKVAKFDPSTGTFTEYPALQPPCTIVRVGLDARGDAWYGVMTRGTLGRIERNTGKITEWKLPARFSRPYDVQADPSGTIWIGDNAMGGALVSFDPRTGRFGYFPSPQRTDMPRLNISTDGAIWYCARSADRSAVGVFYPDISRFKALRAQ